MDHQKKSRYFTNNNCWFVERLGNEPETMGINNKRASLSVT